MIKLVKYMNKNLSKIKIKVSSVLKSKSILSNYGRWKNEKQKNENLEKKK